MIFPTVRLVSRSVYKLSYKNEKWTFKKGIDYTEIHPSFSAYLKTLTDDIGNFLFEVDYATQIIKTDTEYSEDALRKAERLATQRREYHKDFKEAGRAIMKRKPYRLKNKEKMI